MSRTLALATLLLPGLALAGDVHPIGIDLVPFVGSSTFGQGRDTRVVSVNVLGGLSGSVRGVEGAGALNVVAHDVRGVQGSGAVNVVGGQVVGVQGAGALNIAGGVRGFQGAGGLNIAGGEVTGLQGSGGLNLASGAVRGGQLSGGVNIAGPVRGIQGSGGFNLAAGAVHGIQATGGVNVAGDVRGAQLGVVNVARDVKGIQVGIVNVAKASDVSIGLVNVVANGRTHADLWVDEAGFTHAGLTHGGRYVHNTYAVGWRPVGECRVWSLTLGLGAHVPLGGRFALDVDYHASQLAEGSPFNAVHLLSTVRAVGTVELAEGLAIMAGPSWNYVVSTSPREMPVPFRTRAGDELHGWPGFQVGVQLL